MKWRMAALAALVACAAQAQYYCRNATTGDCISNATGTCPAGYSAASVCPTPTPGPAKTPTPAPTQITRVVGFQMSAPNFWYAPDCAVMPPLVLPAVPVGQLTQGAAIAQDAPFWCWATMADHIVLYTSPDRQTWTMRQTVLQAMPGTWEDDGGSPAGSPNPATGISNFSVAVSRVNFTLIAAYTAGTDPNNGGSGGIGLAYSFDWGMHWFRYAGNPILTGWAFVDRILRLPSGPWLYVHDDASKTARILISDPGGMPVTLQELPSLAGYSILGYDHHGCWLVRYLNGSYDGFSGAEIYNGSDCASTVGTKVLAFKASDLGASHMAHVAFVEKSLEGGLLGGPSLLVTLGNTRPEWRPIRVTVGAQTGVQPLPVFQPGKTNALQ